MPENVYKSHADNTLFLYEGLDITPDFSIGEVKLWIQSLLDPEGTTVFMHRFKPKEDMR